MPKIVQIGPYRPQLVEPERFELVVENNKIIDVNIELGYVHRGIEKLFTTKTYMQNLALAERICGICSGVHTLCYAQTAEGVLDATVPNRARYLRCIYTELERLHSHYLWFGVLAHSLHEHEAFLKIMGEREQVQDLLEYLTGNRMNYLINTIGGVRRDITPEKAEKIRKVLNNMKPLPSYILSLLDDNGAFTKKTKGVGILPKEKALAVGAVGPTLRGSGIKSDVRKDDPYAAYGELDFEVVTEEDGDVRAKSLVRARENFESVKIIEQALDNLPSGEIAVKLGKPLEKEEVGRAEAPRGELVYYIKSNGTNIPERVKVRTPSFANDFALIEMLRGDMLQNARVIIESIDPCFACTDRVAVVDTKTSKKRRMILK
ncbi:MAG: nickel-dependent hydrogenase large subunit [Candidatus Bathyarchaeota archaeon]|nr:nickel-dependent hydrogenase large subunit [Candidatus Bathyarchaeota archaeon]MDH5745842.1 nickel-dependent hydrogenase large subunit [Candidatus Bathyarchaeota archaeon]